MRKLGYFGIAAVTALSLGLSGTPAMADDVVNVLTSGSLAGPNIAVGDVLTASLATGTTADFDNSLGGSTGVQCAASTFTASVVENPVAPGTATESTTAQTFGSCTSNILGVISVTSAVVNNAPFQTTVTSDGVVTVTGTDAAPIQTTLVLRTILGTSTCVYRANGNSITGASSNVDNSIAFTDQQFNKFSGSITCPSNGWFSARYAPVLDSTLTDTPAVFVN